MSSLRALLGPRVRVADGGVGTGLQASSLEAGQAPEELALVATFDVVFAVDSIPEIFAVTSEVFIVYAANAFSLLGLAAL